MKKIKRLTKSFAYAFRGLKKTFSEEQNLQIQAIVGIIIIIIAFILRIKPLEWCLIALAISLVFLMEIINSAIERVTDVLKPRIHAYVKEIKDIMAAAVMIASILAIIVGLVVFIPYLKEIF